MIKKIRQRVWPYILSNFFLCLACVGNTQGVIYYDKEHFLLQGSLIPDSLKENHYDRLPLSYKEKVRKPVWNLSKSSAGLSIAFKTNSTRILVRWKLSNNTHMNHMADTGVKGLDLYHRRDGQWQYINTARPQGKENESLLIDNMSSDMREYRMFLPLYDGIEKLEIGIDSSATLCKGKEYLGKPIIFYGTSITQGACASRPGMAHTNIISRKLNRDCINLGFSGNGRMEEVIAEYIAELKPAFYIIECMPNMKDSMLVTKRTKPLVDIIRKKHPTTPIILVENFLYPPALLDEEKYKLIKSKNLALKKEYNKMLGKSYENIFYLSAYDSTGTDNESTVDGVHFTDLGFMRYADFLIQKFREFELIDP